MVCGLGEERTKISKKKRKKKGKKLSGSLPANPVNDRRIANAVTLKSIGGQYRGTKVLRYRYRGAFLVPVSSVLLWYRYRGTLLFFGGTGTLVLFYFLVGILRT